MLNFLCYEIPKVLSSFSFSFSFGLIFDKKVGRKKVGLSWVLWVRGANYLGVKFTLYRSLSLSFSFYI